MFPKIEGIDEKGYLPLVLDRDIRWGVKQYEQYYDRMGLDPSGQGRDETIWTAKNPFQ